MYESTPPSFNPTLFSTILIVAFVFAIFFALCYWKIYVKAGKPGWAALIPIYNLIVMLEIIGKPIWWLFLFLIPVVSIVFAVWMINLFSKSFGQGVGFTIGLLFLPFIFLPILAFGSATYIGPAGAPPFKPLE